MIHEVIISEHVKDLFLNEINQYKNIETGGVLSGHYSNESIIIDNVSGPGSLALHTPYEFIMDKEYMHSFLREAYNQTGGLSIYVGEWHTHLQQRPTPSDQDIVSISERTLEWQHGDILFIIFGCININSTNLDKQFIAISYNALLDKMYIVPTRFVTVSDNNFTYLGFAEM